MPANRLGIFDPHKRKTPQIVSVVAMPANRLGIFDLKMAKETERKKE
jgi:hypothetical protein